MSDFLNGLFEAGAGIACIFHIMAILRDKAVAGFSKWPIIFYSAWGLYNLYYYPHLHQWFSFTGGLFIVSTNMVYLTLIWKYHNAVQRNSSRPSLEF